MRLLLPCLLLFVACGEEDPTCVITYDRCEGGNPCEPLCVFSDEVNACTLMECVTPNDPPGTCQLFANECQFR